MGSHAVITQQLLSDDGVLVLAEHVLQFLEAPRQPATGAELISRAVARPCNVDKGRPTPAITATSGPTHADPRNGLGDLESLQMSANAVTRAPAAALLR
jgi:hypothetical protein